MYRSSPFHSTLNTGYITALDMCEVCTEEVHSVAPRTRVTSQLWTCVQYVPKQSIPQHFEHGLHHSFGHVWSMYRSSPFRSTLNTGYVTAFDKCKVWTPFGHFCPYFHNPYTLLCLKDDFTFTFPRDLIWKFDNPSTTLSLAPGKFDNPYKGAESAGCQKQGEGVSLFDDHEGKVTRLHR